MHTNFCSLNKNTENLDLLLSLLEHKFDIIALSETWITRKNQHFINNLNIQGYQKYHGTLGKSLKGGCGFLIADGVVLYLDLI